MSLCDAQQVLRQLGLEPGMANIALGGEMLAQGLGVDRPHLGDPGLGDCPARHHLDETTILFGRPIGGSATRVDDISSEGLSSWALVRVLVTVA